MAFLAGTLHDIGKLVLITTGVQEEDFAPVGHAEIGAYLLGLWGMPYPVMEAVAFHHRPWDVQHSGKQLVDVLYLAEMLAEELDGADCQLDEHPAYLEQIGVAGSIDAYREAAAQLA